MNSIQPYIIALLLLLSFGVQAQDPVEGKISSDTVASEYEIANSEFFLIESAKFALLEDYEKALIHLDKALELDKNNHAAHFKKAELLSMKEEFTEARRSVEKAIELNKSNKYYYVLAAEIAKQQKDMNGVASLYELMVANTTGWELYGEQIIDGFTEAQQFEKALRTLPQLIEYYPNHPELWLKKAELERVNGDLNEANLTLTKAFERFPTDPTILKAHIEQLSVKGEFDKIETILIEQAKVDDKARILLLEFYTTVESDNNIEALVLQNFEDENAALESKILSIGYLFQKEGLNIPLIDSLQSFLESNFPNSALVFESGGYVYDQIAQNSIGEQRQKYYGKAINSYKQGATLNPNNFEAWIRIFDYEQKQAQWKSLQNDVEYLLDLYPNQALLFYYYAESYLGQDDPEEAIALVDQGLRMASRNVLLKSLLLGEKAKILAFQEKNEEADALFNQALRTEEIEERSIYAYAHWLSSKNPAAAIELISLFAEAISPSIQWTIIKANSYKSINKLAEARTVCENFINTQPNALNGELLELYGDVLFQLGQSSSALVQWEKALTLGGFSAKLKEKIATKSIN